RGLLRAAASELAAAARLPTQNPLLRFDTAFYLAKLRLQRVCLFDAPTSEHFTRLAALFNSEIRSLQAINSEIEPQEFFIRWASLLWRQGFATFASAAENGRKSSRLFHEYREIANQSANQQAIYAV